MLPEDFQNRMERMLADEFPVFLDSYEQECRRALRVSTQKEGWERFLRECPFTLTPVPWAEGGYCYRQEDMPGKHPFHEAGLYYIQEPSAMAPAVYLMEGFPQTEEASQSERVLDLCAAPGGKSFAAALAMEDQGEIIACDLHPHKKRLLEAGIKRLGLTSIQAKTQDGREFCPEWEEAFDLVIADVPCSGLGVIRKKPDIRYKKADDLFSLPVIQHDILDNAAAYVRPGGVLVYSTCTVLPEENSQTVDTFLADHPDFSRETFSLPSLGEVPGEITLWPQRHGTDGFYICRMTRRV